MTDEPLIRRYRNGYAKLLRLYPKPYRELFGEGMEQTFNDLCCERIKAQRGLVSFALWMFVETSAGIVRENSAFITKQTNDMMRIAIGTGLILLIPLVLTLLGSWHWRPGAFVFAFVFLFSAGLTYEMVAKKMSNKAYQFAVGIACATGFVLVWINAAAGIIGDGPVNLMYLGVLAVGFVGAVIARFEPRGMALSLFATAIAQMLVPVIALAIWKAGWQELLIDPNSPHPPFHPGIAPVFGLNAVFAMLWVVSAWLFLKAARKQPPALAELVG